MKAEWNGNDRDTEKDRVPHYERTAWFQEWQKLCPPVAWW